MPTRLAACSIALTLGMLAPAWAGMHDVYVNDSVNQLLAVDTTTGATSVVANLGAQFTDVATDSAGVLYGTTSRYVYRIDPTTGWSTLLGEHGFNTAGLDGLSFDDQGVLYAAGNDALISIDLVTGAGTWVGGLSGYRSAGDLAMDPLGRLLLATDAGELVEVHRDGSGATPIGALPYNDIFSLATIADGRLIGFRGGDEIYEIDLVTGAATLVGHLTSNDLLGYPWGATEVLHAPEPAVLVLISAGIVVLARRQRDSLS